MISKHKHPLFFGQRKQTGKVTCVQHNKRIINIKERKN